MEEARQAQIYGVRPSRTFEQAAAKFVVEHQHKRSLADDICRLRGLMPWIGHVVLDRIHMGTLEPWVEQRRQRGAAQGHKPRSADRPPNFKFGCCRMGGRGGPDLASDAGKDQASAGQATASALPAELGGAGSPVSRSLPPHLAEMALFAVNTGCRTLCRDSKHHERTDLSISEVEIVRLDDFVNPGTCKTSTSSRRRSRKAKSNLTIPGYVQRFLRRPC
jgi:hypothetical protein